MLRRIRHENTHEDFDNIVHVDRQARVIREWEIRDLTPGRFHNTLDVID